MSNLVTSFPDLTFNATKVAPSEERRRLLGGRHRRDGHAHGRRVHADGRHVLGRPSSPTTGTAVSIGPETFAVWADEAASQGGEDRGCTPKGRRQPVGSGTGLLPGRSASAAILWPLAPPAADGRRRPRPHRGARGCRQRAGRESLALPRALGYSFLPGPNYRSVAVYDLCPFTVLGGARWRYF